MDTPQEVEVWYILPSVRKEFVVSLKKLGMKQKDISRHMGLTQAAVSQYLKNKRGNKVTFNQNLSKTIEDSSKKIIRTQSNYQKELQYVLRKIKTSRFICNVCKDHINAPKNCDVCY